MNALTLIDELVELAAHKALHDRISLKLVKVRVEIQALNKEIEALQSDITAEKSAKPEQAKFHLKLIKDITDFNKGGSGKRSHSKN